MPIFELASLSKPKSIFKWPFKFSDETNDKMSFASDKQQKSLLRPISLFTSAKVLFAQILTMQSLFRIDACFYFYFISPTEIWLPPCTEKILGGRWKSLLSRSTLSGSASVVFGVNLVNYTWMHSPAENESEPADRRPPIFELSAGRSSDPETKVPKVTPAT